MSWINSLHKIVRKYWSNLYWLFAIPLVTLYFSVPLSAILFLGVVDVVLKRKSLEYGFNLFGIQMEAVIAIIAGIIYGPLNGALVAGVVYFVASVLSQNVGPFLLWKTPGFGLLAAVTAVVYPSEALFFAFQIPIAFRLMFVAIGLKLTPSQAAQGFLYEGTAPIFTLFLFQALGENLVSVLSV